MSALSGLECTGRYLGEDWQIDFTHMPKAKGHQYLLFWVDTFTGWIETFPCRTEQEKDVKTLIHEIIPHFFLPLMI